MALLEANGDLVEEARLYLPRTGGAWHAELRIGGTGLAEGDRVTLAIAGGQLELHGTARSGGAYLDTGWMRVVAGAGGLGVLQPPKFYRGVDLRIPLGDLLRTAGEALAATADAPALAIGLPFWTVQEAPVGLLVGVLMRKAPEGTAWRFLADGSFWLGQDSYPDAGIAFEELGRDPIDRRLELGVEAPLLLPGTSLAGERVGAVEHLVHPDRVRTVVYLES